MKGYLPGRLVLVLAAVLALALAFGPLCFAQAADNGNRGFLFDESSTVSGSGDVSIKGSFNDYAVASKGWMKGSGSIRLESLRNMNKTGLKVGLTQKSDLVFGGGQIKNRKKMELPLFQKGIGATVSERFNLSHVDKNESSFLRSRGGNSNFMVFDTALAFEGLWDIKNTRGFSINMNKSEELYKGSFQAQKKIQLDDSSV